MYDDTDCWYSSQAQRLRMPNREIKAHADGQRYLALCGYAHVLAVFEGVKCIGWIDAASLGFNGAKYVVEADFNIMPEDEIED